MDIVWTGEVAIGLLCVQVCILNIYKRVSNVDSIDNGSRRESLVLSPWLAADLSVCSPVPTAPSTSFMQASLNSLDIDHPASNKKSIWSASPLT